MRGGCPVHAECMAGRRLMVSLSCHAAAICVARGGPLVTDSSAASWRRGLPRLWLTRGLGGSGGVCGLVDCLVFDGREAAESSLPAPPVVGALDPGDDRQAQLLSR